MDSHTGKAVPVISFASINTSGGVEHAPLTKEQHCVLLSNLSTALESSRSVTRRDERLQRTRCSISVAILQTRHLDLETQDASNASKRDEGGVKADCARRAEEKGSRLATSTKHVLLSSQSQSRG